MKKPELNPNQYAVGQADHATGHVLKVDKSLYEQDGEVFLIFESLDEAYAYIKNALSENEDIEFWIENSLGEFVTVIDKNGKR